MFAKFKWLPLFFNTFLYCTIIQVWPIVSKWVIPCLVFSNITYPSLKTDVPNCPFSARIGTQNLSILSLLP